MHSLVSDLAIVLGVAAATSIVLRVLRQPSVLGYLVAGLLVGPLLSTPLFADVERLDQLSEFGVILVMFSIGLEFSVARLLKLLPASGLAALVQIGAMAWLGYAFALFVGLGAVPGLFVGASVAISSTMVVAKVYDDHTPGRALRRLVFGVLVVQDVVAVIFIAALTAVASGATVSLDSLASIGLTLIAALVAALGGGLLVIPRLVRFLYRIGNRELLVVAMAALAFCAAVGAARLGYSAALGAFLAGMLVAESGRGRESEHIVAPLRDLFTAIFFVTVGMGVDPAMAVRHLDEACLLTVIVVGGQLVAVSHRWRSRGQRLARRDPRGGLTGPDRGVCVHYRGPGRLGGFAFCQDAVRRGGNRDHDDLYNTVAVSSIGTARRSGHAEAARFRTNPVEPCTNRGCFACARPA